MKWVVAYSCLFHQIHFFFIFISNHISCSEISNNWLYTRQDSCDHQIWLDENVRSRSKAGGTIHRGRAANRELTLTRMMTVFIAVLQTRAVEQDKLPYFISLAKVLLKVCISISCILFDIHFYCYNSTEIAQLALPHDTTECFPSYH